MIDLSKVAPSKEAHQMRDTYFAQGVVSPSAVFIQHVSDTLRQVDTFLKVEAGFADSDFPRALITPLILPEPVDPHLVKARELVATYYDCTPATNKEIIAGNRDHWGGVQAIAQALREAAGGDA